MVSYSLKLLDTLTQKQSNSKSNNLLKLPETNKKNACSHLGHVPKIQGCVFSFENMWEVCC